MNLSLLNILRCPFCGSGLTLQESFLDVREGAVSTGILYCQCCAYPILAGIPCLCIGPKPKAALQLIERGDAEEALFVMLGLEGPQREKLAGLLQDQRNLTFRKALETLSPTKEGIYLLYRFSDPTFLASQAVLQAIGRDERSFARPVLDLCGGTGHLTRCLTRLSPANPVILADVYFWKLWLAKQFITPACHPVCCDAEVPLPFARHTFSLVLCSDAFHYLWSKRLAASEMIRLTGNDGVTILAHLHNALSRADSDAAGMPLTPSAYRNLFEEVPVRIFKESAVLDQLINSRPVDLEADSADDELEREQDLILLATQRKELYRAYETLTRQQVPSALTLNPLYQRDGKVGVWKLRSPSQDYERWYPDCKRYLLEQVELSDLELQHAKDGRLSDKLRELARRHILLDLPERYY